MSAAGIRNREAYIRKMILDGYIVRLDLSDVRKMVKLLSNATSNLNQIARRANETRSKGGNFPMQKSLLTLCIT
jgi:hypothetical protein